MAKDKPRRVIPKTRPTINADEFMGAAKPLVMTLHEEGDETKTITLILAPRVFSSGGFGWHGQEKANIQVGNVAVRTQIGLNVNVIGSKPEASETK